MKKKELKNIEPFKDLFYQTCYTSLHFSVVKHFGRSLLPFLANDIYAYNFKENIFETGDIDGNYLITKHIEIKPFCEVLNYVGISRVIRTNIDNIVCDLKYSLDNNKPIFVIIDAFYHSDTKLPFNTLGLSALHSAHHDHFFIVYGYDDFEQIFRILDVQGDYCFAGHVSYKEMEIAYNSKIEKLDIFESTYFEFSANMESMNTSLDTSMEACIATLKRNIIQSKDEICLGIKHLGKFVGYYEKLIQDENLFKKTIHDINDLIFYKKLFFNITYKNAEKYRNEKLLGMDEELNDSLDSVVNNWNFIRAVLLDCKVSDRYNKRRADATLNKLKEIYECEQRYNNRLLEIAGN